MISDVWKKITPHAVIHICLTVLVIVANFSYRHEAQMKTPPDTVNTFVMGNYEDYHQYIRMIRFGMEGNLLYHNAFSEEPIPDVVFQPVYNIAGYLSRPFGISAYDVYFYFRLFTLVMLFWAVYELIRSAFTGYRTRILGSLVFFSATGFWTISSLIPFTIIKQALPFANFDIYLKYLVIPPQHNLALAFLTVIFTHISGVMTKRTFTITTVLFAALCFIHPYIQYLGWIMIGFHAAAVAIHEKNIRVPEVRTFLSVSLIALPFIGYNIYIHGVILKFGITNAGILSYLPRDSTLPAYIEGLGPLFFTALPALFFARSYAKPIIRMLLIWAFLPMVLYFLPDFHIPFNTWRLYQIYQHIPLAVLSAYTVSMFVGSLKNYRTIAFAVGALSFTYGAVSFLSTYQSVFSDPMYFAINRYIPVRELKIFKYLDTETPPHSVVIAGTYISNIVPSFTHNHVVIGHNGLNRNYIEKQKEIGQFLGQQIPADKLREFLKKYHASYIIFGTDAPKFSDTIYRSLPFLKVVYETEGLSVVQVL